MGDSFGPSVTLTDPATVAATEGAPRAVSAMPPGSLLVAMHTRTGLVLHALAAHEVAELRDWLNRHLERHAAKLRVPADA